MYDLFFIFTLYFNEEYCHTNFINYRKSSEDVKHFKKALEEFGPFSDDLLLFFYLNLNSYECSFMTTFYYLPYKNKLLDGSYNLSMIQNELLNHDEVIDNILKYYFKDVPEDTLKKCRESLSIANTIIRESGYDDRIKSALYSFLIDPLPIIQRLSYELMTKEFLLSKQYEKHYAGLISLQEKFDYNAVSAELKNLVSFSIDIDFAPEIVISFCCNNKNHIRAINYRNSVLLILGTDYVDIMQYLSNKTTVAELHEFGTAISEKNRVAILQFIHESKEVTIKEIEQTLDLAGTNAYYHLALMIRTGMLKTRNQGRTILYSIDHKFFDIISETIKKYSYKKE